jgi:CRP-like cAMP-binding protein
MSILAQSIVRNRLLALLSPADFRLIEHSLEPLQWQRGDSLVEPDQRCDYVYFPETAIVSIIVILSQGRKIEVGLYGRDGVGPTSLILGSDQTPHRHFVQVEGCGFRLGRQALADAMALSSSFRALLLRYCDYFTIQTSVTALSNGSSLITERLARWLLMCHDRVDGDHLNLTHDFLALMLGVRRSSVTDAIHILEGELIIRAARSHIEIRNREKLERVAVDSYGLPEAAYERLVGPLRPSSELGA